MLRSALLAATFLWLLSSLDRFADCSLYGGADSLKASLHEASAEVQRLQSTQADLEQNYQVALGHACVILL